MKKKNNIIFKINYIKYLKFRVFNCPKRQTKRPPPGKNMDCYNCGKPGHKAKYCREPPRNKNKDGYNGRHTRRSYSPRGEKRRSHKRGSYEKDEK